ncbi:MAG TPA: NADH-quinone oxidoreductase subunit A [Chthonomonadales bacterium]|nr:NADH-quinone oxidoreductase subunit A [Chthonomonadales bacterium]
MLASYVPVLVMMFLAAIVATAMIAMSALLGPRKPTRHKQEPYECGMAPVGSARERFPVRFYLIAMFFIIFDIEVVFLYPWAVTFRGTDDAMQPFLFAQMAVFVGILFIGYLYLLGKGALNWDDSEDKTSRASAEVRARRMPIRFGNEASGPVKLPEAGLQAKGEGA